MSKKQNEIHLERNEFHQVQLTYSYKVAVGDQAAWDQLLGMALEAGNIEEGHFEKKAPKTIEEWQALFMLAGDRVKEISVQFNDLWMSDMQGTTEYSFDVKDQNGRLLCDSIGPSWS